MSEKVRNWTGNCDISDEYYIMACGEYNAVAMAKRLNSPPVACDASN